MMRPSHLPPKWAHQGDELEADCRIFQILRRRLKHPHRPTAGEFFVMDVADWAIALGLTSNHDLVMVNQFRYGTKALSWEPPGGLIDPGETPVDAAVREFREETGYIGVDARQVGWCYPNPAIQTNRAFFVRINDCEPVTEQQLDENEDILVSVFPIEQVHQMIADGEISHCIAHAALLALERSIAEDGS